MRQTATALHIDLGRTSSWLPSAPPLHLTSFIGRDQEVQQVQSLLRSHRLVTLTGVGGSGKTRLASEAVRRLGWHEGEEWVWVELATLNDPGMLPQQVMAALGFQEVVGDGSRTLVDIIRDQATLLVFDNCEHLVDACATLADHLLRACPAVRILTTSRETLGVSGERPFVVPPLSIPTSISDMTVPSAVAAEAVELFADRARAIVPSFQLNEDNAATIARICHRLDGLPLAIELAAARIKVLGPEQIAELLDDSFHLLTSSGRTTVPRHRTLWAAMDWSYELLTERERSLLRRLSVFSGGFTLDAVASVCGDGNPQHEVLDMLTALVDKSLVVAEIFSGEARYTLLETVREFAAEQLRVCGQESTAREQHADYYLDLAWAAEDPMFGGASDTTWVAKLETERANLRVTSDWCESTPRQATAAVRLATALHWFWFAKGRFGEARSRLTTALRLDDSVDPIVRARALTALGHVAIWQGDDRAALASLQEAVSLLQSVDDRQWMSYALSGLGAAHIREGRPVEAHNVLEEAVGLARTIDTKVLLPFALYWQGICAEFQQDSIRAKRAFDEATAVARERGHTPSIGHTYFVLGRLARREGNRREALAHFAESLAALHETDDRWGIVNVVDELARVAAADGTPDRVAKLLGFAEMLREEMGVTVPAYERNERDDLITRSRETLGESLFADHWSAGRSLSVHEALGLLGAWPPGTRAGQQEPVVSITERDNLQVNALGSLQIIRGGTQLGPEVWRSARARELLVYLLCHPQGRSRDQIGLAFWPDASTAQVRDNVNVTLHRLRRALGRSESVVLFDERYAIGKTQICEFDVATFEHEMALGQEELRTGLGPARIQAALALYRGDFLEGEGAADWHLEHRDRLQRQFVDALLALADWQSAQRDYVSAAEAYRRIILSDELHEAAYRGLMTCHAELGERTMALRLYGRLSEALREELGCEPDRATVSLYTRLRAGAAELQVEP